MDESLSTLMEKQVVNFCDGKILGYVTDFIVDSCSGRLKAIILPGDSGILGFKKCEDTVIPWEKICKIGVDVILVEF